MRRRTRPMTPPPPPLAPPPTAEDVPHIVEPAYAPLPNDMPPPASGFNPWKVLIPSLVGLLVIFGVIYAFSRNDQPAPVTPGGTTLAADPNSSPVEPATPATGSPEANLPMGGNTTPDNSNQNVNASTPLPAGSSPEVVVEEPNANANDNSNRKPANPPLPSPTNSIEEPPPGPSPAATKAPSPKPTLPKPSVSPPENPGPGK